MAASTAKHSSYREYAQFLRLSADRLNMAVAPARLEWLRGRVNAERNTFLAWEIIWLLIGVASAIPALLLFSAYLDTPMPAPIAARAAAFYLHLTGNGTGELVAMGSLAMFLTSVAAAGAPIVAHNAAINDLEHAHRTLKAIAKG